MKKILLLLLLLVPNLALAEIGLLSFNTATTLEFTLYKPNVAGTNYIRYKNLKTDCAFGDISIVIDGATSSSAVDCANLTNVPDGVTETGRYRVPVSASGTNGQQIYLTVADASGGDTPLWTPLTKTYSTVCGIGEACAFPEEAVTVGDIVVAALAKFASTDSGEAQAVSGSVAALSGAGSSFWSSAEQENIRSALGVTGTKTTATGGQLQDVLDDTGTSGVALTASGVASDAANKFADHFWRRQSANIQTSANGDTLSFRSGFGVIAQQTHKQAIVSGVWTIYLSDDVTAFKTRNVTSSASAEPITSVD